MEHRAGRRLLPELSALVLRHTDPGALSVVLYGSRARGSARPDSDVDVLEVVAAKPRSYSTGNMNISAYHPHALGAMAERGSLFMLHLKVDGVVLADPCGVFRGIIESYRHPASYAPLLAEVRAAATALVTTSDTDRYRPRLRRLGLYLLRTAVYATLAERGDPVFDTEQAGRRLGRAPAVEALRRRLAGVQPDDLAVLLAGISSVVGSPPENRWGSVEALAVAYAHTFPYASALLAQLIAGDFHGIEYTALSPPPL
ncbi:MAG TPA: nucleotidyltransferase domain-containing protein [Micromonosporaceae bacterium]|nr:nucleotidyltransferase domain-containing protein [Micromonosporaceae bacterium]